MLKVLSVRIAVDQMRFCKAVPRVASLPELRAYNCQQCGVTVTEAEEPRERRNS